MRLGARDSVGRHLSAALLAWTSLGSSASAQNVEQPRLELTLEAERLRSTYHFTSPSSFDTTTLVPHVLEQTYRVDTLWFLGEAHWMAGIPWRTIAGATPPRDAAADDYDTFFQPDGSVVVSGTTGDARMHAVRVSHEGQISRAGPLTVSLGYRFRLDLADFGVGHKTVTRGGVLVDAFDVTSPEATTSQLHEFLVSVSAGRRPAGRWLVLFDADASPATLARLTVRMSGKYPGQDLTFQAHALSANARIRAVRTGSVPFEFVLDAGELWGYRGENSIALGRLAFGVSFGLR